MREVAEPFIQPARVAASRQGADRAVRRGNGESVLHDRYRRAALRAMEIRADIILKGTKVDGVFTSDPLTDPAATRFDRLTHLQVIEQGLKVMDATAISLCMDNAMPIVVFNLAYGGEHPAGGLRRAGRLARLRLSSSSGAAAEGASMNVTDADSAHAEAERRMDGAVEHLRRELSGVRTGRALGESPRFRAGRGLRHAVAAQPGGGPEGARADADCCPSRSMRHRSEPSSGGIQSANLGLNPEQRRARDPDPDSGADRRTAPGNVPPRAQAGRRGPHRRAAGAPGTRTTL